MYYIPLLFFMTVYIMGIFEPEIDVAKSFYVFTIIILAMIGTDLRKYFNQ